ncbi:MAG TPA: hypothetical protein VFO40_04225 [Chthoniobacterales bacterium]|nr:hypothetical protein [Chthoniobacterales bacterium]
MPVDARSRMHVFEQIPGPALRPFIRRFIVAEFSAPAPRCALRDTSPVAAFSFRGGYRIDEGRWVPPAAFTGLRETLRAHEHCDGHAVLWATFYTGIGHAVATYTTIDWRLPPDRCRYHEMADWPA